MPALLNGSFGLVLLAILLMPTQTVAQQENAQSSPVTASGTLNLVLANKNGFVVAADSRMSSEKPFECNGRRQLYCDNSQKLFRTTPNSAMVIAGFAVGHFNTPLDLAVSSVILKTFAASLWSSDDQAYHAPMAVEFEFKDALMGVAAMSDPAQTRAQDLSMWATFARFDSDRLPVVEQKVFVAGWRPTGPQNVLLPDYTVTSGSKKVTQFFHCTVGITLVADEILSGQYLTTDPVIQNYYRMRTNQPLLDQMSVEEMVSLTKAILAETRKYSDLVGGEDQISAFQASGKVQWSLPANLPSEARFQPTVFRWDGITCSNANDPPCGIVPLSFSIGLEKPADEGFKKLFLASEFFKIPVALDNNLFIADTFDRATLRWLGGSLFMLRNAFKDCVLELPDGVELPVDSELIGKCSIRRKENSKIDVYTIVGARPQMMFGSCVKWNSDHRCEQYSSIGMMPPIQP